MKMEYIDSLSFYKLLTNEKESSQSIIKTMIDSYIYLLNSLKMLGERNIVHYDLKHDNILFNKDTELPLVIDFGISLNMNNLNFNRLHDLFYVYATDYYIWSFDIHIINFLVNEVDSDEYIVTKDVFSEIMNNIVDDNKALQIFSETFINKYKKKCMFYGTKIIGKDKSTILKILIKQKNYQTWDNFSLSCMYLLFIQQAFKNNFPDSEFLIKLSQLLCVNISPDPQDRFTIEETIQRANSIVKNIQLNDLTSLANSLQINSKYIMQEKKKTELKTISQ